MKVKISSKYKKTVDLYLYFAREYANMADFSLQMQEEMYIYESTGKGSLSQDNGFALGKRNMDIAVSSWLEDIEKGYLWLHELYEDENLPHWFLDRVMVKYSHRPKTEKDWHESLAHFKRGLAHKHRIETEKIEREKKLSFRIRRFFMKWINSITQGGKNAN